jgi:hypothetical protein
MKHPNITKLLSLMLLIGITILYSCKDDEKPTFTVENPTIDSDEYTGPGTLVLMYSTDGTTFSTTLPKVHNGEVVTVKISNGTEDLTTDDYSFDWSGSSPAPSDVNGGIATFTAQSGSITIGVTVEDLTTLISSNRTTGKFYSIDKTSGAKTEIFTPMLGETAVLGIRGFVYHPSMDLFYATTSSDEGGIIYQISPSTKMATIINDNNAASDPEWYGLANLVVMPDDSLLALGWLVDPNANILTKFGKDGKRSQKQIYTQGDLCCGLGMLYDIATSRVTIASDPENGSLNLVTLDAAGKVLGAQVIANLINFPSDMADVWLPTKCLVKDKDGVIYGIMFNDTTKESYLVKVSLSTPSVTYIATLGANSSNQHNSLALVPNHTL